MTFLGRVFEMRGLNDPQVPITAANIWEALGYDVDSDAGEGVSETKVLGLPAVLRGATILSSTEAGLPLKVYAAAGSQDEVQPEWLNVSASTGQTWFERVEQARMHRVLWGEAFWLKYRDGAGRVVDVVPIHPARVRVDPVYLGREKVRFSKVFVIDGAVPLTDWEVMHIPGPSTNGLRGIPPVTALRQSLGIALASEKTAANVYGKGMFHAGILTSDQPVNDETAQALKNRWRALNSTGSKSVGEVAVLGNGATFQPTTMPPGDAQFLESRMFSVTEVGRWLGIPGWMLNDQEKSTSWGTGMEQQFISWVTLTVKPEAQRFEHRITAELCQPGQVAKFKLEGLLRGDSQARAAFYASGIQHGWLVPNDIRPLEDLPDVAWGDEPYLPYNQSATGQATNGGAA